VFLHKLFNVAENGNGPKNENWRDTVVERRSLAGELSLFDLDLHLTSDHSYMGKSSAACQPTRPTQPFILSGSINE